MSARFNIVLHYPLSHLVSPACLDLVTMVQYASRNGCITSVSTAQVSTCLCCTHRLQSRRIVLPFVRLSAAAANDLSARAFARPASPVVCAALMPRHRFHTTAPGTLPFRLGCDPARFLCISTNDGPTLHGPKYASTTRYCAYADSTRICDSELQMRHEVSRYGQI